MTDDPLALDAETMRKLGYRAVDMLVDRLTDPSIPPLRRATPQEMAAAPERARARGAAGLGRDPPPARRGRAPLHEQGRPSRILRVRPVRRHLAGSARRPDRQRDERLRGLVDGGRGAEPGGARGDRLVQGLAGLPGRSGRAPRQRRLGGEPHGARVCARDAGRLDVRRPGRLRLRSGAFVGGASRTQPRLPAEPGSRDPDGQRARDARRPAPVGDGSRRRGESQAALRLRERRCHEQRRRRPAGGSRRALRRAGRVAARGRGVRRVRGARRARAPTARRDRGRGLDHARPAQVALPAVRVRLPARPQRRRAAERVHDHARLPEGSDRGRQRGQLLRPRPPADQDGARVQGLVLDPVLRARRVPARDRADVRARRSARRCGSRPATGSSSRRCRASASSASGGASTRTRIS